MATTAKGAPYPAAADANDVPVDLKKLADWVDARPGVSPLTTAARDALAGVDLWDGRVILNVTTNQAEFYDAPGGGVTPAWRALAPIAADIPYAGSTDLAARNVEAALDELDAEKISIAAANAAYAKKAGDTFTGYTEVQRGAIADTAPTFIDSLGLVGGSSSDGTPIVLRARLARFAAGTTAAGVALDVFRLVGGAAQSTVRWLSDRVQILDAFLDVPSGVLSARMRQAERFTGAAETTTGLAYAGLPTATEVDFVVPPSERGTVHLRADISNSGADFSFMGFDIFDVAGAAVTQAASDDVAVYRQGTSRSSVGVAVPVLLPAGSAGKTFRVRARHRVTGGTGTFSRRQITVVPSP